MKANTRLFGEIDIADDKIISLEDGMIGLPEYRNFALIFDEEKEKDKSSVMFPVMQPNLVRSDYNPMVNDEMLRPLGGMTEDNTYVLVTLTAAPDPKDTSVNLKAPIVINTDTRRGAQIIVEDDYPVKYKIYDVVKGKKKAEE